MARGVTVETCAASEPRERPPRGVRFITVGVVASAISLVVQQVVLGLTNQAALVTAIRLAATLPLVYVGYSRYVLGDELAEDRTRLGAAGAEIRMMLRVAASLGASVLIKLALEPWVTHALLGLGGVRAAGISVLLADFTYGPLVNYVVLRAARRRPADEQDGAAEGATTLRMASRVGMVEALGWPRWAAACVRAAFRVLRWRGVWRRPRRTTGDFGTMTLADKIHWLYKADEPLVEGEPSVVFEQRARLERAVPNATRRLRLSAVGDVLPYRRDDSAAPCPLGAVADLIFDAQVSFANLECPLVGGTPVALAIGADAAPRLRMSGDEFDALCQGRRFDLVSTANNHALDFGVEGVESTISALNSRGIRVVGTSGPGTNANEPALVDLEGVRVGFVAVTFGVNGLADEAGGDAVDVCDLNGLGDDADLSLLARRIREANDVGAELVVVSAHWGLEYEFVPRERQRRLARRIADLGAHLIIGHHPHVLQPLEWVESSNESSHPVAVLYSLGNLTNPLNYPANSLGAVASIEIAVTESAAGRRVAVESVELVPVLQVVMGSDGLESARVERLSWLSVSAAASNDAAFRSFVEAAEAYADRVVGTSWRQTVNS